MSVPDINDWNKGDEDAMSTITGCYCPACQSYSAKTLCLPTKVPFFREIIIMALHCEECNFKNSEVSFGGEIQTKGTCLTLTVSTPSDLNRQIIKSDSCSVFLPSVDLEIPAITQRGQITTLEGVLMKTAEHLQEEQPYRLSQDLDVFTKIQAVINKIRIMAGDDADDPDASIFPYTIVVDDPSGNSYVENLNAPMKDPQLATTHYVRTATQDMSIGLQPSDAAIESGTIDDTNAAHKNPLNEGWGTGKGKVEMTIKLKEKTSSSSYGGTSDNVSNKDEAAPELDNEEALRFPTPCPHCRIMAETKMCVTNIPHFKEVIIMALNCESCGYKSNEVKGGGAIPSFGTKVYVVIEGPEDMGREILKSDTAGLAIPEIELELEEGSLDGVYTTIEGIMDKLVKKMTSANPFSEGDSSTKHHLDNDAEDGKFSDSDMHKKYKLFIARLTELRNGKVFPFTIILDDPLSNSFIGPKPDDAARLAIQAENEDSTRCYEDFNDAGIKIEEYTRTDDQNEALGLDLIKTEGYEEGNEANYGTDRLQDLSDRFAKPHIRGLDHPFPVAKAPVEGDYTVMGAGAGSVKMSLPYKRGEKLADGVVVVDEFEVNDAGFVRAEEFEGAKRGMVFKRGGKGVGYYTDRLFVE